VGGDFFQILPHPTNGSLLIVAGDVVGKGLQAGMLVALLVGAIRTSADFDPDPLVVLKVLNQRLWDAATQPPPASRCELPRTVGRYLPTPGTCLRTSTASRSGSKDRYRWA
jgi:hypothetical protein